MYFGKNRKLGSLVAGLFCLAAGTISSMAQTKIDFYYPVQVGGPLAQVIDGYVEKFKQENPDIDVAPIYSGSYIDTTTKALTAAKADQAPTVAVLLATDIFTLLDEDIIEPVDDFIKTDEDKSWVNGFMPAYLKSAQVEGHLWAVPFQRSTAVMYYNKQAFEEAGLDPEKAPMTWDEMVAMAESLTIKDNAGQVTRWGIGIPTTVGSVQWLFTALAAQNGAALMNEEGTQTYLTDDKVVDTLEFLVKLSQGDSHPNGIYEWGTAPNDFMSGRVAMIWHTTGNLGNIRRNASFPFAIAPLPGNPEPASVLGGGNLYIFKDATEEQKAAAFKFIQYLTSDEVLADWSIQTGYVAPRDGSWQTDAMQAYVKEVPQALVARDQIPVSVPEFSTYDNMRTTKLLNDAIAAALIGSKTPQQALEDAQAEMEKILKPYR